MYYYSYTGYKRKHKIVDLINGKKTLNISAMFLKEIIKTIKICVVR